MNDYQALLDRLFSLKRHNTCSGLSLAESLSKALNSPFSSYPCIHVAGTNGKGSVSTKMAKALQLSGYKVGLFTSPHLYDFRERISINGNLIEEREVAEGLKSLFTLCQHKNIPPTFFELVTFLAFLYFQKQKVDVAIFETGLGGRLDATNVVTPKLSVITSLSLDHTDVLGKTIEEIAYEKSGIVKEEVPVVVGPTAFVPLIIEKAKMCHSLLTAVTSSFPSYDRENSAVARAALQQVQSVFPRLTQDGIEQGLLVKPPCRLEKIGRFFFDVAHNPGGFARLFPEIGALCSNSSIHVVMGMAKDKDLSGCLRIAAQRAKHIYLVELPSERSASSLELASHMKELSFPHYSIHRDVSEGISSALQKAMPEDVILFCGSFYLMAAAKRALGLFAGSN